MSAERDGAFFYQVQSTLKTVAEAITAHAAPDGGGLTCTEADALVDLYRAVGLDAEADRLAEAHADSDEETDSHYVRRIARRVHVENTYTDGYEEEHDETIQIRERTESETDEQFAEYLDETLFAITGTGHGCDGGSHYRARSIDGLEPKLDMEWSD
jgi:hypothetical protein